MPRSNRVDPFGDLHATAERGLFMGNRGCLVDDHGEVVRHHRGDLWITCAVQFRGRRVPLADPGRYTPLFFLDDAVALAAGHRPCGECRHRDYVGYQRAVTDALGSAEPIWAGGLNRMLHAERFGSRRGRRGISRASERLTWSADATRLPGGTVVVIEGLAHLVHDGAARPFGFDGWGARLVLPSEPVAVLTPPTSVRALGHGFAPTLHPSATA